MRSHVIEVGPGALRRLCCGSATIDDPEAERTAFESIDDEFALRDSRPVAVASLWSDLFGSIDCGTAEQVTVVYPSWWSDARVELIRCAAVALVGTAETRPRTWLLSRASPSTSSQRSTVVVEIADDFVVVTGDGVTVESRRRRVDAVAAEAVAAAVRTTAADGTPTVVVDAPATIRDAATLACAIIEALPSCHRARTIRVDDIGLRRIAGELKPATYRTAARGNSRWAVRALTVAVFAAAVVVAFAAAHRAAESRTAPAFPITQIVEGHVTLQVPQQWVMRRVIAGPGSARVQLTSADDSEVGLHVTQSRVAVSSLEATAEFVKSAIDEAPDGAFVDFNPADVVAGRRAVTYREVRAGHVVRWIVWVDGAVRISIGCQSRRGNDDAVNQECDLAVRTARVLN